jgi:hypothetical protein
VKWRRATTIKRKSRMSHERIKMLKIRINPWLMKMNNKMDQKNVKKKIPKT